MPEQGLITAYQRARKDLEASKKSLQKACDFARDVTIVIAQSWLDENYPDVAAKVTLPTEDIALSVAYHVHITQSNGDVELGKALLTKLGNELEQYLESVKERNIDA
jgi:hypothetical protein